MFVGPLIRYFASERTILGISNDPKNPGMALIERSSKNFWHTFQPSQAPLGLVLLVNRENTAGQIHTLVRSLPGYALGFSVLQQDPDFSSFGRSGQFYEGEPLEYIKTARLTLHGNFEDYWENRTKDLIINIERRCRNIKKLGFKLSITVDKDSQQIENCIKEYGELEEKGWKGRQGTAVGSSNTQILFYKNILKNFCDQGEGIVYKLLLDEKCIASQICLERDGILISLKIGYDENFKKFSPGFLLQYEIFKKIFSEKKIRVIEFYGRVREGWTMKWTDEIRSMYHINFYRYSWVAPARRALKYGMRTVAG
jgi:hypothetical protein